MKYVWKVVMVVWCTLFAVPNVQAMCFIKDVGCLAPFVLDRYYNGSDVNHPDYYKEWSAIYGRTYPINKGLVFAFRFDEEATTQFIENDLLALEFDFIVRGSRREEVVIDKIVTSSNLNNAEVGYDTPAFDGFTNGEDTRTIGVHILKPQVLRAGQLYIIVIKTKNELPTNNITFTSSVQVTLNLADFAHLSSFLGTFGFIMNEIVDFYDEFKQDKYFVLETDPFGNSFTPGDGCKVGWDDHVNSRPICDENENFDNINISTEGNHTHIIHPDYRCSKELPNGKILCWENGGDTNCWDAYKWYEFNGNIDEVSSHHNDSNWTTTRERSMCSEVYNSGDDNSSGGNSGGNSGPGYGDDSGSSNPWAGYDHDVGLKYVKIGKKSSGHWHESVVWTENEIPNHRDFRIKVKKSVKLLFLNEFKDSLKTKL